MAKKKQKIFFEFNKHLTGDFVIMGIDSSLNHTAVVVVNSNQEVIYRESIIKIDESFTKDKVLHKIISMGFVCNGEKKDSRLSILVDGEISDLKRFSIIRQRILEIAKKLRVTHICIEDCATRGSGKVQELTSLINIIKLELFEKQIYISSISPKTLKAFIADNGSATKEEMRSSILSKYNIDLPDDNEADALGLALTLYSFGYEIKKLSQSGGIAQYRKQMCHEK